ncbi:hypothetical protein HZC09_00655 [Candidatus Micrarchaeota archaeon]|nr:hypothetical protein [Candidatus Micrarchaeota archaeon]
MNIRELLSTEEREKILGHLLGHPAEKINMNALARTLKVSPGQVHKYVAILRKEGLAKKDGFRETPVTRALRVLFNLKKIKEAGLVETMRRRFRKATGIGVYGSWAAGTNVENADLDLWLKMQLEPGDLEIARARKEAEKRIGAPVDFTIATPERLERFREKSDAFYFSLYHGILLWGEDL